MIRSMTGFGRAQGPLGAAGAAEVSARSVNHRFLELTIKLRDGDAALEPVIRKAFSSLLSRGKVEVSIRIRREDGGGRTDVSIDEELAAAIVERVAAIAERLGVGGRLEARDLLTIPGVVSLDNGGAELAAEEIAAVERVASEAARALVTMRETEGRQVALDLDRRIETLQTKTKELAARREEMAGRLLGNLRERLAALVPGLPIDPGRLEQEAALAADRSDVSEELQRLDGHLAQFRELLQTRAPVGKKLEFLSQEILRELNTLGSKGKDLQLVRDILEMKSETEKIREQVLNVE
jgi:uncharacterized protein (TIGR00255 family)